MNKKFKPTNPKSGSIQDRVNKKIKALTLRESKVAGDHAIVMTAIAKGLSMSEVKRAIDNMALSTQVLSDNTTSLVEELQNLVRYRQLTLASAELFYRIGELTLERLALNEIKVKTSAEWFAATNNKAQLILAELSTQRIALELSKLDQPMGDALTFSLAGLDDCIERCNEQIQELRLEKKLRSHPEISSRDIDLLISDYARACDEFMDLMVLSGATLKKH